MSPHLVETFERAFTKLRGHVHRASSWNESAEVLLQICAERGVTRFATAQLPAALDAALRESNPSEALEIMRPPYDSSALPNAIDRAGVGATGIEFAIAETATLVEVSRNDATRLVSGLPRVHVGVVSAREFVPGLFDAAPRMRAILDANPADCVISFLSGPSRTGDIELRLTLGVHGPEEAHVLILDESLDTGAAPHG
jgi:L-lactate dehydrogenase complex protein LldG